ncbi:transposable element Tc1 transposase [Trichonephila clavipes]|nr:transposable element Tc1 transposase [Trichonephila clavipes]
MPLRKQGRHYQHLTDFERGRVIGLQEGGFSYRDIAERLGPNVSTVHDFEEQWSRDRTASRRPGSGRSRSTTESEDRRIGRHLRATRPVAFIPLNPSHCRLRRQWCQAKAHWRTEWRSVVFFDESKFCLGASDGRVLVKRRLEERLQPNCLQPRQTGPTPGVMVWDVISYDSRSILVVIPNTLTANLSVIQPIVLPFMNIIQGEFPNRITLVLTPLL